MAEATLRHGNPVMVDYTAGADIVAGEVIVGPSIVANTTAAGLTTVIAHKAIANTELGAVAAGGGVYDVKVDSNYVAWTKVYWDVVNDVLTTTSTNNAQFGYTVEAAAAANAVVKVLHDPSA